MNLIRAMFLVLAVMLPVSWTVAQAADPAAPPAGEQKDKKGKKEEKKP